MEKKSVATPYPDQYLRGYRQVNKTLLNATLSLTCASSIKVMNVFLLEQHNRGADVQIAESELMRKAGLSKSSVLRAIRELVAAGLLVVVHPGRGKASTVYRLPLNVTDCDRRGVMRDTPEVSPVIPQEPSRGISHDTHMKNSEYPIEGEGEDGGAAATNPQALGLLDLYADRIRPVRIDSSRHLALPLLADLVQSVGADAIRCAIENYADSVSARSPEYRMGAKRFFGGEYVAYLGSSEDDASDGVTDFTPEQLDELIA